MTPPLRHNLGVALADRNPQTFKQALLGAVAAAGPNGLSITLLCQLTQNPWTRQEVVSRLDGYEGRRLVTIDRNQGRVAITQRGLADRDRWRTHRPPTPPAVRRHLDTDRCLALFRDGVPLEAIAVELGVTYRAVRNTVGDIRINARKTNRRNKVA